MSTLWFLGLTVGPILTIYTSYDVVGRKDVTFGGPVVTTRLFGRKLAIKPSISLCCKAAALKQKISKFCPQILCKEASFYNDRPLIGINVF